MKSFEFSYVDDNKDMHFVVVYDDSLISAMERVLGRGVSSSELRQSGPTGNWFVTGWENTNFTVHEQLYQPSSHVVMPQSKPKVNPILEGLI